MKSIDAQPRHASGVVYGVPAEALDKLFIVRQHKTRSASCCAAELQSIMDGRLLTATLFSRGSLAHSQGKHTADNELVTLCFANVTGVCVSTFLSM